MYETPATKAVQAQVLADVSIAWGFEIWDTNNGRQRCPKVDGIALILPSFYVEHKGRACGVNEYDTVPLETSKSDLLGDTGIWVVSWRSGKDILWIENALARVQTPGVVRNRQRAGETDDPCFYVPIDLMKNRHVVPWGMR